MKFEIYKSFKEVKDIWQSFEREAEMYVFQSFNWISSWYNIIGKKEGVKPFILIGKNDNNEILFLLPLGIKKNGIIKTLQWLGGIVTDYHGPLISKDINVELININDILKEIKKILPPYDIILFEKQPEYIGFIKNPFVFEKCKPYEWNSYSTNLVGDWDTYYKKFKSKTRNTNRRKRKALEQLGKVEFTIADTDSLRNSITKTMIQQKSKRQIETKVKDMFKNDNYQYFYSAFNKNIDKTNPLIHISALYQNGEIIATHWGIIYNSRFYYLMPTFKGGAISKYSPGKLLLIELIKWCYLNNIKIFDFTIGDEAYKKEWCEVELKLYKFIEPVTIIGLIIKLFHFIKDIIKGNEKLLSIAKRIKRICNHYLLTRCPLLNTRKKNPGRNSCNFFFIFDLFFGMITNNNK